MLSVQKTKRLDVQTCPVCSSLFIKTSELLFNGNCSLACQQLEWQKEQLNNISKRLLLESKESKAIEPAEDLVKIVARSRDGIAIKWQVGSIIIEKRKCKSKTIGLRGIRYYVETSDELRGFLTKDEAVTYARIKIGTNAKIKEK